MRMPLYIPLIMAFGITAALPAAAQVPTKSARVCAHEYSSRKPDLVGVMRHKANFIALCRVTPVGVATPSEDEALGSRLDVSRPDIDYKDGFIFTPAYLSSPQVFNWLRHRPQ